MKNLVLYKRSDICRFHRTDLWGILKREKKLNRLSRKIYLRKRYFPIKLYEVINFSLDKVKFKKKKN